MMERELEPALIPSMMDIAKQVAYWRDSAKEDWAVAFELVHGGLQIHNPVRLADLAGLQPSPEQRDTLAEMNAFHLEGRYPESLTPLPTVEEARGYMTRGEGVFQWLMNQL
jgi:hypothetical protein